MIVDIEAWLPDLYLPKVEVGPGSPCEPEVVLECEAQFEPRVGIGPGSPRELEVKVEIGA